MKNGIFYLHYLFISFIFFLFPRLGMSTEFASTDWSVSYNVCEGSIQANILYYNKDGVNDWMDYLELYYRKADGSYQQIFLWINEDNYNCTGCCCTDVTDDTPFSYGFTFGQTKTTWDYYYVNGNTDLVAMTVKFFDLPNELIGTNVTMRINGTWHGGGGDNDVEINNWEKSVETTSINSPTGLSATVDDYCDRVHLTWTNPASNPCNTGNWEVQVYRDNTYIGTGGKIGAYDDYTAVKGQDYDYKVRASFKPNSFIDNTSAFTDLVNGRRKGPLPAPSDIQASSDRCDGKIFVQWLWTASNPDSFLIQRSTNPTSGFITLSSTISGGSRTYLDESNINPNSLYYYRMKAKNNCGDWSTSYSSVNSPAGAAPGIPSAPTKVKVMPDTNQIVVTWHDNAINESGFIIERAISGGGAAITFENMTNDTIYYDTDVDLCTNYIYTVKAKSACFPQGVGTSHADTFLTPMLNNTFLPGALEASKGYFGDKIQLEWTNQNDNVINNYKIYRRKLESGEPWIQIASENPGTNIFVDQYSEAGVLYEYQIQAEGRCEQTTVYSNTSESIGFRMKSGTVTGQVSYSGGIAVENAKVTAENTGGAIGNSLLFSSGKLRIPDDNDLHMSHEIMVETWIKPNSYASNFGILEKNNNYKLYFDAASNAYKFTIYESPSLSATVSAANTSIPVNNYSHIVGVVSLDSIKIFINGNRISSIVKPSSFGATIDINNTSDSIFIGQSFTGNLDETRIWNIGKSPNLIQRDFSRIMTGNETGLVCYLRLNEGLGKVAYDASKAGTLFNKNHALIGNGISWSTSIPTISQLSPSGYTDATGNYTVIVPYNGAGEVFKLTPSYLAHTFNPSTTALFIGDGANVHNNVNFVDQSSFRVQGSVSFKNTSCGVAGAPIKVDGVNVIVAGAPATTDALGNFDIRVPIGDHIIEVAQPGHVYSVGRFPSIGTFNFQGDLAGINFVDSTLIKIVGRVVGGQREANKIPGLGKSKNNIGQAELIFKSQLGNGCSTDTIKTDTITGEYCIYLPPLKYVPTVKLIHNPAISFGSELIDLTGTPQTFVEFDSVFDNAHTLITIDSAIFNKRLDYIYRSDPQIVVFDKDGINPFIGDTLYTHFNNKTGVQTNVNLKNNPFKWPVFHLGNSDHIYRALIKVFELYSNFDHPVIKRDSVPTTDGKLQFNNELADLPVNAVDLKDVFSLNSDTTLIYSFKPGIPNFNSNTSIPAYSYTKTFQINLITKKGQVFEWKPVPNIKVPLGGDNYFRGYLLGARSTGEQFVTEGPEVPDYVLRDPPGSSSSASRLVGSTKTEKASWSWNLGASASTKDLIYVGTKFNIGIGVSTETDVEQNTTAGYKAEISGGRNGDQIITTTNLNEWSTYNGKDIAPGAASDLYIGKSRNMTFGIAEELTILPQSQCDKIECIGSSNSNPADTFTFGKNYGLSVVPTGYETQFIFSEFDITHFIIPNLKKLRSLLLQTNLKYTSHLSINDPNYGKNNDDPVFGVLRSTVDTKSELADLSGPSYTYAAVNQEDSLTGDSVRLVNTQIGLWEHAIYLNEWEKVNISNSTIVDSLKQVELDSLDKEYEAVIAGYFTLVTAQGLGGVVIAYGLIAVPVPGIAFAGYATFAVTSATGVGLAELAGEYETYLQKKQRILDKFESLGSPTNYTLAGGNTLKSTVTHTGAASLTNKVDYNLNASFELALKAKVNNTGAGFTKGIELSYKSGRSWSTDTSETETVTFNLNDPDIGDLYSVDVYPSLFGWGPIFKNKPGGATSCPFEREVTTTYYNPGTVISEKTLQIEKPKMSVSPSILTNIPIRDPAVFNLTISNESEAGHTSSYIVAVAGQSNPFGAGIRIDNPAVTLAAGTSINKVVSITKGPGPVYNYDSLLILVYSPCQFKAGAGFIEDIVDSIYISAHFLPTCTDLNFASPQNSWVVNNTYHDTMPIAIVDYNYNFYDFQKIKLEYKPSAQQNWIGLETFSKDTSGSNNPAAKLIPQNTPFTLYDWDVSQLPDGLYDLRISSKCALASLSALPRSGVIDRINPHVFGNPSPADGILSPNDELSIKFNEPIDLGSINPNFNFDIRGVLNGSNSNNGSSLLFNGAGNYLQIDGGWPIGARDFTFECELKRNGIGEQVIYSQGIDLTTQFSIGFTAANKLYFKYNNTQVLSNISITDNIWHHIAFSFNNTTETIQMYLADQNTTSTVINTGNTSFLPDIIVEGPAIIGKNSVSNNQYFNGNLREIRIWNAAISLSQFSSRLNKLIGANEPGILYNYRMDEAQGTLAQDHVRRRDATIIGATWQITPNGYASNFDGTNDYLKITTGDIPITDEMDFTMEFWFNSNQSSSATLFSNGSANGTDADSLNSWKISKDSLGIIHVWHDGIDFVATNTNYFDGQWHHFALVMNRNANLTAYVDGNIENSTLPDAYHHLAGPSMYIGAHGKTVALLETVNNYYNGKIDEFRIWNVARTLEQLLRDKQNRMSGDELGLKLYLPFESYAIDNTGIPILTQTFDAQSTGDHPVIALNGASLVNTAPTIKLQRPVQQIAFTYSVNNDQIIFTPTTAQELIENVTLDITVAGIQDLHGNFMVAPKTWIAYVDKNQVVWKDDVLKFNMKRGDNLHFTTSILNKGGASKVFEITDIPSYLTVTPSSGVIKPNSTMEIEFDVDPNINLGQFIFDIGLLTDFNFKERLNLEINVKAENPGWVVDKTKFEYTMSIIGLVKINNVISIDKEDMIAAFVGQELRGVANVEFVPSLNAYRVFLNVFSNASAAETLSFKIWDASAGKIYSDVTPVNLSFTTNQLIGSLTDPQHFNTGIQQSYEFKVTKGWNWLTFFLDNANSKDFLTILQSVAVVNTDQIKHSSDFSTYNGNNAWNGGLNGTNGVGIIPSNMYKLFKSQDDTLILKGTIVNPSTRPVTLVPGWTWLGFISVRPQTVTQALGNLNALDGDIIKSKSQFAVFKNGLGWIGSLKTMNPSEGFMYKSLAAANKTFTYPLAGMFDQINKTSTRTEDKYWEVNHSLYSGNMTIIARVNNPCSFDYESGNFGLGFKDSKGDWRGKNKIEMIDGQEYCFITVGGNETEDLKVYFINKEKNEATELEGILNYTSNSSLGGLNAPHAYNLTNALCQETKSENKEEYFNVYPNLVDDKFTMDFYSKENDIDAFIRITDMNGKAVFVKSIEIEQGINIDRINLSHLTLASGIYMVELHTAQKIFKQSLVKN